MRKTVYEFLDLIKTLRAPGGCPWDREQTHESIKNNLLEETYEAYDAILEGDPEKTKDELGDLLMQIIFHAVIGEEEGQYDLDDIAGNVYEKMVRRHPHVFGENVLDKSSEVLVKWEEIKKVEKGFRLYSDSLYDVVRSLPELKRAEKLQNRAAKAGFDWKEAKDVLPKLSEELTEIDKALKGNGDIEEEIGDLLFTAVNLARKLKIDPEEALGAANKKFIKRFAETEKLYNGEEDFANIPMEEKDRLWEEAKEREKR